MTFFERAFRGQPARVALYDHDPALFADVPGGAVEAARAQLTVVTVDLERGPGPPALFGDPRPSGLGLLVTEGLLLRSVELSGKRCSELLGPGDLLRPWDDDAAEASMPRVTAWDVLTPARVAILDRAFLALACNWPPLVAALVARGLRRSRTLALQLAIADLRRVDERLLCLLWHFADRWGIVQPAGVVVPLAATHDVLAQLVAAERPTVTSALQRLSRQGLVTRQRDRTWLLPHEPPQLHQRGVAAHAPAAAAPS